MTKTPVKNLLYLSNTVFLVLYLLLSWNNRLTADDFYFLNNLHQYGILKGTFMEYNTYSTRWLSVLVVHTVLSLMPYFKALFLFGILSITGLILSFSYFIKSLLRQFFNYSPDKLLLIHISIFCINALFYSSMNIGEIWFWLSASPTYLWSFMFFVLGCGIIISPNSRPILKLILLFFSFLYIGGSAEAFAAVVLLGLLVSIFRLIFFNTLFINQKIYLVRLSTAFFACLISLTILYFGHGNTVRLGFLNKISIPKAFLLNINTTGWIGLHWISRILPFALLFSLPLLYAGKMLAKQNMPTKKMQRVTKTLVGIVLLYGALIFIINYPVTYLLAGIGPARALITISFLTWVLFAFSVFYISYKTAIKQNITRRIAGVALALCLLINTYNVANQYIVTSKYATKYDLLMEGFVIHKDNPSLIKIQPLPPSGMLKPLDVAKDSLTDNNVFIKKALGLKAYIMLDK